MNTSQKTRQPSCYKQIDGIDSPIIFFDGECMLCNGFVDFMLEIDTSGIFRLAPLQGQTARQLLPPLPNNCEEWSMFYVDEQGIYQQSDAALQICRRLGGFWYYLSLASIIPSSIRDFTYRIIARNRYRWFGRRPTCRKPSEQEKARFLP